VRLVAIDDGALMEEATDTKAGSRIPATPGLPFSHRLWRGASAEFTAAQSRQHRDLESRGNSACRGEISPE
jgi:hypothetical protein